MNIALSSLKRLGYAAACLAILQTSPAFAAQLKAIPSSDVATPTQIVQPADSAPASSAAQQITTATAPAPSTGTQQMKPAAPETGQNNSNSCPPPPASQEAGEPAHLVKARTHLYDVAYSRLISMASKLCYTESKPNIEKRTDKWVATYKNISPDTLIVQVKPIDGAKNRFMGLIKYAVLHYEASADTKPMLAKQDYQMVKRLWQLEILRFDGKTWK